MKRVMAFLCTLMVVFSISACTPATNAALTRSAETAAVEAVEVVEGLQHVAESVYALEQWSVLEWAQSTTPKPSQDEVMKKLLAIRERWRPIWDEFKALRSAHNALREALSGADDPARVALLTSEFVAQQAKVVALVISLKGAKLWNC